MSGGEALPHTLHEEANGLFRLEFVGPHQASSHKLFPRELVSGSHLDECFYCGMTSHVPASCPSKYLGVEIDAISEVGHLNLTDITDTFKKVYHDSQKVISALAAGVDPSEVRKNQDILVYVAYLDVFRIFRLRFLMTLYFFPKRGWSAAVKPSQGAIEERSLFVGFDCLRVGQYDKARQILENEILKKNPSRFFAAVGLGFISLELGNKQDMRYHLEKAQNLASSEVERIYIHLLFSRYHQLENDTQQAEQQVSVIFGFSRACMEARYRRIQLKSEVGLDHRDVEELISLIRNQKEFFTAVLMDPSFAGVQGMVEEMLVGHFHTMTSLARKNLAMARKECDELVAWFDKNDEPVKILLINLANLEELGKRQGYYDVVEVADRAKGVIFSSQRLRDERREDLDKRLQDNTKQWQKYKDFWDNYSYQQLYKSYFTTIMEILQQLSRASSLVKGEQAHFYREAAAISAEVDSHFARLDLLMDRMNWWKMIVDLFQLFGKKLLVVEIVCLFVGVGVWSFLSKAIFSGSLEFAGTIASDPSFPKKMLLVVCGFLAPFFALVWTAWSSRRL